MWVMRRRGLGVDLASLEAEASVDAVGRLPKRPLTMATGPTRASMPSAVHPLTKASAVATDGVRGLGVAVRIPPGPVLTGDREFLFDLDVVALECRVVDGPVGAHAVEPKGV